MVDAITTPMKRDQRDAHPARHWPCCSGRLWHLKNSVFPYGATKIVGGRRGLAETDIVILNLTGTVLPALPAAGAVTSTRSSVGLVAARMIMGRSCVTESAPTMCTVAFTGPSTSMAMIRSKPRLLSRCTVVGVAIEPSPQLDGDGVAIMQDVDVEQRARQQRVQHDRTTAAIMAT